MKEYESSPYPSNINDETLNNHVDQVCLGVYCKESYILYQNYVSVYIFCNL